MIPDGISFVTLRTVLISLSLRFLIYNMAEIWSGFVSILPFIYLLTDYLLMTTVSEAPFVVLEIERGTKQSPRLHVTLILVRGTGNR